MSKTSVHYQLPEKGGHFTKTSVPYPTPGPNEICIRTKAIDLNPIDWKIRSLGIMVEKWPVVLGADAAGIVESVGENIKNFRPGDEVFNAAGTGPRTGAFQEIMTVSEFQVAKKPASLSFEEAASLPICYITAATAIVEGLKVPLPHLDPEASRSSLKSILVVGGSSACGAAAIQLLRLALPSATILTTSSAQHHDHLKSLGATKCFDRSAQDDTSAIKAATPDGAGVDGILDAVTAAANQPAIFSAFNPSGPKFYSQIASGMIPQVPEGVNAKVIYGRGIFNTKGGMSAIPALGELIESGKYKLPIAVDVVGKGFDAIELGVDRLQKGVSGTKLVVSI